MREKLVRSYMFQLICVSHVIILDIQTIKWFNWQSQLLYLFGQFFSFLQLFINFYRVSHFVIPVESCIET